MSDMSYRGILFFAVVAILFQIFNPGLVEGSRFRIVSGRKATTLEFPYQVDIERMTLHWCGGSIIHKLFVLTAAHCVKSYEDVSPISTLVLRVRVGNDVSGSGGQTYQIERIIPHEKYVERALTDTFDIAVVKLQNPFVFHEKVKIIRIASFSPKEGEMAWVTGFGRQEVMRKEEKSTVKRHLMAVQVPIIDLDICKEKLPNVADDMICAGHKKGHRDSCTGDSGGPLVVGDRQVGIVAWGIGCGREGLPGVYTNVAMYKPWIEDTVKNFIQNT